MLPRPSKWRLHSHSLIIPDVRTFARFFFYRDPAVELLCFQQKLVRSSVDIQNVHTPSTTCFHRCNKSRVPYFRERVKMDSRIARGSTDHQSAIFFALRSGRVVSWSERYKNSGILLEFIRQRESQKSSSL